MAAEQGGNAGSPETLRPAAEALVDLLAVNGVERVFCVPGESFLAVLDALHGRRSDIATIACRQEGGAAMMAEADGKLTGRPGICFVSRGPGATNASAGLHVASQDSTPLIMFIGQVPRHLQDREAFQEIDYRRMFGQLCKWVAQIDDADRLPEYVTRAFAVAMSGRPGPVVLALPDDMLTDRIAVPPPAVVNPVAIHPSKAQLKEVARLLRDAKRPMVIVGGSRWDQRASDRLADFAEANALPVAAAFRRQDRLDNEHPCYCGPIGLGANPKLRERVAAADLLMVLGSRLGDASTDGYRWLPTSSTARTMIHVHAGAEELWRIYRPDCAINATPSDFIAGLAEMRPILDPPWADWCARARAEYLEWQEPRPNAGSLQLAEIFLWLRAELPADAIIANGAGNFAGWLQRFHRFRTLGSQLAPTSGSMGYGVPAAIAAKLRHPERTVICVAGDGDFLMTGQELATAVQFDAEIVILVVDNGMYGTIRMHQEQNYPSRVIATELRNPDFAALARAYGAFAETVETSEAFAEAFRRAARSGRPALLHLKLDPEALTPARSLSEIRDAGLRSVAKLRGARSSTR